MLQYNEGEYATMWVDTSLIITPTESSQGDPTTPSEPTTPTNPTQETEEESQIKIQNRRQYYNKCNTIYNFYSSYWHINNSKQKTRE